MLQPPQKLKMCVFCPALPRFSCVCALQAYVRACKRTHDAHNTATFPARRSGCAPQPRPESVHFTRGSWALLYSNQKFALALNFLGHWQRGVLSVPLVRPYYIKFFSSRVPCFLKPASRLRSPNPVSDTSGGSDAGDGPTHRLWSGLSAPSTCLASFISRPGAQKWRLLVNLSE